MTQGGHIGASLVLACAIEHLAFRSTPGPGILVVGALLGNLPDFDALAAPFLGHRLGQRRLHHHRFVTHTPLLYLLLSLFIALFSPEWALRVGVLTLFHLVLDSWHTDDGVMWLWPLNKRQFSLWPYPAHAEGRFGWEFYRHHLRRPLALIPEMAFALSGGAVLAAAFG
ncbi:MAG: metal-dependent hydrolase [Anaerolineae bacterium]|jgi:membrane-bound metal-dependent hydrolase YbcI (DUF457 family)|nr:metal-dependent hydrolase [Anaerolineae bacterium]